MLKHSSQRRGRPAVTVVTVGALLLAGGAAARVHRIERGDTLGALAQRYGVSVSDLVTANRITDPNHILAGSRLVVPGTGTTWRAGTASAPARAVTIRPDRARLAPLFDEYAARAGVPADLAKAMAWQESGWQSGIVSSTRAVGVMQLMPATVDFVSQILLRRGENLDPTDPAQNILMGTRFLRYLLARSDGDVETALAAYYQGLRSVRERGVFPDTVRYIANIQALRERF